MALSLFRFPSSPFSFIRMLCTVDFRSRSRDVYSIYLLAPSDEDGTTTFILYAQVDHQSLCVFGQRKDHHLSSRSAGRLLSLFLPTFSHSVSVSLLCSDRLGWDSSFYYSNVKLNDARGWMVW